MITAKDYKPPMIIDDRITVKFVRDTVVSEKELEKVFVEKDGKEMSLVEWIKQVAMRGEE